MLRSSLIPGAALALASSALAETRITIEAGAPSGRVSPMHYGLMTEEINHSYDGGLYGELLRNRVLNDDPESPVHWSAVEGAGATATLALDKTEQLNDVLHNALRVDITGASPSARAGVANSGYWGIPIRPSTRYTLSFFAKGSGRFFGSLAAELQSEDGSVTHASASVRELTHDWVKYDLVLHTAAAAPVSKGRFVLLADAPGSVWLNVVSLFPPTWNNRPNGLRRDLMQMLVDLKPKFLRFPGGNYLEGDTPDLRFPWKETLGPISRRKGHPGCWGYRSSDGMGLLEFLLWCKDMGAEPLVGLYAGYSLKGTHIPAGPELEPYVQDALDELEYITGPITTRWGHQRALDGHPEPFVVRYVEIGNEDWFDKSLSYDARFAQFHDALRKHYPHLKLISSVGYEQPKELWVKSRTPDLVDEHYYRDVETFLKMGRGHYDAYERKGSEIFVGEWAAYETPFPPWDKQSKGLAPTPTMRSALGDAALMAGMERNSDFVVMQCYAPLLANVNGYQWRPNMIGYDALSCFGSPSYYAFRMFSTQVGDSILRFGGLENSELIGSVTKNTSNGLVYVKLVNPTAQAQPVRLSLEGVAAVGPAAEVETLAAAPEATNSIDAPRAVVPVRTRIDDLGLTFAHELPAHSITVLTIPVR